MFGYSKGSHTPIIVALCKELNPSKYLELGLYDGFNINQVKNVLPNCIFYGVDIVNRNFFGLNFFNTTTDIFFEQNVVEDFDVIFIDADHSYKSVLRDLENSLKVLSENGVIFVHDTDPKDKILIDPLYCGDSYKINEYLDSRTDLEYITLPISEAGLTIIKRKEEKRFKKFI